MNEISQYLEQPNPDFDQGFGLFCKYSRNQSLMSWIGRKKDMTTLLYELQKLASLGIVTANPHSQSCATRFNKSFIPPEAPAASPSTSTPDQELIGKIKIITERTINRDSLPEDMKALYDENVNDYKILRAVHEKMKNANSDLSRAEFRSQLISMQTAIKKRWATIDSTLGVNTNPEWINQHKSYISKIIKRESLTEDQRTLIKQKFNELVSAGAKFKPETLKLLKEKGF